MLEKEIIFTQYAISEGFEDWAELITQYAYKITSTADSTPDYELRQHIFAACDLVQKEQQKRIAENAQIRHDLNKLNKPNAAEYGKYFGGEGATYYCVESSSILSENNLIK